MTLDEWFVRLWEDYAAIAPQAASIRTKLEERGERIVDDHVAFRTLDVAPIALDQLGAIVEDLGYEPFDDYDFPDKKLRARSYTHPDRWPRIFLSELLVDQLAVEHAAILRGLVDQIDDDVELGPDAFWAGTLWEPVSFDDYAGLRDASEYAAWVAALGLRPNHFTLNVNGLDSFRGRTSLLNCAADQGFALNTSGGAVKGSPEVFLEQGSTMADRLEVEFAGGARHAIPTCYYEFALRYPADGGLYDGFVAASADKIFESTDSAT